MPPWPIAMPSSTAIVLNSRPTPPASAIDSATSAPMLRRCTCPGTNWVKLLAIATIGLPKSPSVMPVARHSARAPVIMRPWVDVFERSSGMRSTMPLGRKTAYSSQARVHWAGRSSQIDPNGRLGHRRLIPAPTKDAHRVSHSHCKSGRVLVCPSMSGYPSLRRPCSARPSRVGVVGYGHRRAVPSASRAALRTMGAAVAVTVGWWLVSGGAGAVRPVRPPRARPAGRDRRAVVRWC